MCAQFSQFNVTQTKVKKKKNGTKIASEDGKCDGERKKRKKYEGNSHDIYKTKAQPMLTQTVQSIVL